MTDHKVLMVGLRRARREIRDAGNISEHQRLTVVQTHLNNVQSILDLSQRSMKRFLQDEGVNLVTVQAHGSEELKQLIRQREFRVKVDVAKQTCPKCLVVF